MAPVKGQDASKSKRILDAREKVLKIKRDILKIVESMLDEDISKDWFLQNCSKLCHAEYDDVIQERSIVHMCGYPLCSEPLKQITKQKYRISSVNNKVYDLTDRKCFCSNECYKASNFVKHQLSPIPIYMRKETSININLISDYDNKGSAGEEIVFHHSLSDKDIEEANIPKPSVNSNYSQLLQEEIKKCADSLGDLKIQENVYENPYIFENQSKEQKLESSDSEDDSLDENDESENDDQQFFQDYENLSVLSKKQMPIPEKSKKAMLITPLNSCEASISSPTKFSMKFIRNIFQDWMTEDTMKYLLGERQLYEAKADMLFQRMIATDPISTEKLASIKKSYIDLCLKVDKLKDDDDDNDSEFIVHEPLPSDLKDGNKIDSSSNVKAYETISTLPKEITKAATSKKTTEAATSKETTEAATSKETTEAANEHIAAKSNLKRRTKKSKSKSKGVTFATSTKKPHSNIKELDDSFTEPENPVSDPVLPLIDSISQNALRRQVIFGKLKSVYFDILPLTDLQYRDIRDAVKGIVETFSLTPTNIVLKPKEWRLIAVVLCWILANTVLKDLHEDIKFEKLCKDPVISASLSLEELKTIGAEIISPQQLQKLQNYQM